ncbi:unnamed protein product [Urochloa humidicola]
MDPDGVAKAFIDHYYTTFETNRVALEGLFQEGSMLTFGGENFMGTASIMAKLTSLEFSSCKHQMFHLMPVGPGNFYVHNNFRVNYV